MGGLIALTLAAQRMLDGVVSINAPQVYRDPDLHKAYDLLDKQEYVTFHTYKSQSNVWFL